ncbi:MAG TPA: lipoyl synthase [Acidimicrobiales bacterium]|nr:lipoyl synthase [Acidimicrobiales bacterium]
MIGQPSSDAGVLRIRCLGRVGYADAHALQRALQAHGSDDYLLILEHPHVFTLGVRGDPAHVLVDPAAVGAEMVRTDRGGDVTYHGPGQLVVYPVVSVPPGSSSVPAHVARVEQMAIDALAQLALPAGRLPGYPGVWADPDGPTPRKVAAVGVRIAHGRSMHGIAINVDVDLRWFERIVPCGISDKAVTTLRVEGIDASMDQVIEAIVTSAVRLWSPSLGAERQDVRRPPSAQVGSRAEWRGPATPAPPVPRAGTSNHGSNLRVRLRQAGVDPDACAPLHAPKPAWLRVPARMGADFHALRRTVRSLDLVTVCEEAGCPNIFDCWAEGTATFMINGERCTRACGFCLVDTRRPGPLDHAEPDRVACAVERLGLAHAVVTAVARDDLPDGGADAFVRTVGAIRRRCPGTAVELLIPDCKGNEESLARIFDAGPDVLNHNLETVARLQRAVRPSAGYARSLSVLARAKDAGLTTKSGLMVGLGEAENEVLGALADLAAVGVDIVTIGQYLRPTAAHLPVTRWWTPEEFGRLADQARAMGFAHVQASPLTRSSYHARTAAHAAQNRLVGATA